MKVTFIYYMSFGEFKEVKLEENGFEPNDNYVLQFKNPLKDGGEMCVYGKPDGERSFRTCAVTVERNGRLYGKQFKEEPMGFRSCLEEIYRLEDNEKLERVVYHDNKMPEYSGDVKSDTLFLDYENKKIYLVYSKCRGFCYKDNVYLEGFDMNETQEINDVFIQAEFKLENGGKLYAYADENNMEYNGDAVLNRNTARSDGMAWEYDGRLYKTEFNINSNSYGFAQSTGAVKSSSPENIKTD